MAELSCEERWLRIEAELGLKIPISRLVLFPYREGRCFYPPEMTY